ncbi:MAG: DUF2232 domain-containing protein [Christensenellaceae bacterium]|nr:DUF2232 domain-containing protein [Christensenellaceae bacterium]
MEQKAKKINPALETLIMAAIFFVCAWLGKYIYITYIALPFIGAYVYARHGLSWEIVIIAAGTAVFWFLEPDAFIIASVMFALPSLITGAVIRRKTTSYEAVILSAGGWLLAFCAAAAWIYFIKETDPLTIMMDGLKNAVNSSDFVAVSIHSFLRSPEVFSGTLDITVLLTTEAEAARAYVLDPLVLNTLRAYVISITATLMMKLVIYGGLGSYFSARALAKRFGNDVQRIPQFKMMRLPIKTSAWFVLMYILTFLPDLFSIESLQIPAVLLQAALSAIFLVQGTTLIAWLFGRKLKNKIAVLLSVLIAAGTTMLGFSGILTTLGFFDVLFKVRDRFILMQNMKKK